MIHLLSMCSDEGTEELTALYDGKKIEIFRRGDGSYEYNIYTDPSDEDPDDGGIIDEESTLLTILGEIIKGMKLTA